MRRDRATSSPEAGRPSRPRPSTARRGAERVTALTLAFTVLGGAVLTDAAPADPVAAKQEEARQVASQLSALEHRLSALDEEFNTARLELARIEQDIADAQARVEAASADMEVARDELRRFAVNSYVSVGDAASLDAVVGGNLVSLDERRTYAEITTGSRRSVIEQLEATRQRSDAQADELDTARARAAEVEDRLADRRAAADAAVDEQERLQSRVRGELASLVQQENERRAAEERVRAEAVARRQAAELAAATPARPATPAPATNGAGTGTTTAPRPAAPVTPAPAAPAPPVTGDVSGVIAAATSQIGVPYVWAGSTPAGGFDCSGFTMWAWAHGGKSLPHSAAAQYSMTRKIPLDQLQPGDLVFYGRPIHHVALYVGNGTIVHAPGRGRHVKYDSIHYWSALVGAGRL